MLYRFNANVFRHLPVTLKAVKFHINGLFSKPNDFSTFLLVNALIRVGKLLKPMDIPSTIYQKSSPHLSFALLWMLLFTPVAYMCCVSCKDNWRIFSVQLLRGNSAGSLGRFGGYKVACRDMLRAEFAHRVQRSLIYEQAKQHRGSELCFGIQIIQGSSMSAES